MAHCCDKSASCLARLCRLWRSRRVPVGIIHFAEAGCRVRYYELILNDRFPELRCAAILFDMDGTLVDSTTVVESAWGWWALRHGLPLAEILAFSHGRPTIATMEHFRPGADIRAEAAEMERYEENRTDGIVAVAGAAAAVHEAQKGPWGVVTSAPRLLAERRLATAGFPLPPVLVPVDEIECGKPDPEGYWKAAKLLGVAAPACIVFEDTRPGIEAAQAAGMTAIGLLTTFPAEALGSAWTIQDFRDIRVKRVPEGFRIFSASLQ
jgi:mannitol-1-/sugar-/sorbitol-6-phosphatase